MRETRVGISDMSIYIPQWKIDLEDILQRRAAGGSLL
jgi:3-hydroxy-3-methylglutaryl CoA synthase